MNSDDIDDILTNEEQITPSAGFVASVMSAVEREAAAPPPLAFPWMRMLPGFLVMGIALIAAIWQTTGAVSDPAAIASMTEQLRQVTTLAIDVGLQWVVLVASVTIIAVTLSSSLFGGKMGSGSISTGN